MTKTSHNSGSIVTNSNVAGVITGANSEVHAQVSQVSSQEFAREFEALRSMLEQLAANDAQQRLLAQQADELKAAAASKDEGAFRSKAKGLTDLLQGFGTAAKTISGVVTGIAALGTAAGVLLA